MKFVALSSPHGPLANDVTRVMGQVLLALLPGIIAMIWFFGWGVLVNVLLASATAVIGEAAFIKLRGRDPKPAVMDLSAVVTGVLLGIALPPLLPWWMTVLGVLFAIIIVKQLYGGLGYNPFNPAMAGYVLLLISFPAAMTQWLPPNMLAEVQLSLGDSLNAIFLQTLPPGETWDTVSGATPLDEMFTRLDMNQMVSEIKTNPLWGDFGARGWEWVANFYLLGGLFLLWRKIITWHIPVAMIASLLFISGTFYAIDPESFPFPAFHLFSGGMMLGAFFIATDPVSTCASKKGQLIFGASIGVLVFVIRTWGGFPDAVAFAVLLMNMAAPTIDYYTKPPAFGQRAAKGTEVGNG